MSNPPGIGGKGHFVVAMLWGENALSATVIVLKLYTRHFVKGQIGPDDYSLVFTWLLMMVFASLTHASAVHGLGEHAANLTTEQFANAMYWELCAQPAAAMAIGTAKVTVALFLMRIINARWQRNVLWFCITLMMILSILLSISLFAQCTPVQSIWDPRLAAERVCTFDMVTMAYIACSWAAVMDFFLAIFPWIVLRNLNMKRKERLTICASLSLGVIAGICGVIRTADLGVLSNSQDYLYASSGSLVWSTTEITLTIVCVSVPALRPLWNKWTGSDGSSAGYGPYSEHRYAEDHSNTNQSYHMKPIYGGIRTECAASTRRKQDDMDGNSDKGILEEGDSITCTTEVSVAYEGSQSVTSIQQQV